MDNVITHDVFAEFRMHDSDAMNEDTLAVQAHVKQATIYTAMSPDDGLSATDRLCCSDDYLFFQNVKCENEQPEAKNEDHANCQQISSDGVHIEQAETIRGDIVYSQQGSSDDVHIQQAGTVQGYSAYSQQSYSVCDDVRIHTTLKSVDNAIPQFNENDSVELVFKSDSDEHDSNCELPRHWIVCETGVLKAVKAEPIQSASLTDVDCGLNLDAEQEFSETNHADILETQGMNLDTKQELSEENHADILETRSHSTPQVPFTNPECLNTSETTCTGSASSGGSTKDDCSLMCAIMWKVIQITPKNFCYTKGSTPV